MKPPLFAEHPPALQAFLAILVPIAGGFVAGLLLLGLSEPINLIYSIFAIGAGFFGGLEHVGADEGALRGLCGGVLFGTFILVAKQITGADPKADIPHPEILLVVLTALLGIGLGALGGRMRQRREAPSAAT